MGADSSVRNIIVALLGAVGDVVLSTPLLEALRLAFPSARITYLVGSTAAPALDNLTWIDHRIVLVDDPQSRRREDLRVFVEVLRGRFDLAFCLTRADKLALMFWLSRVPVRVGYTPLRFSRLFTHVVDTAEPRFAKMHRTEYFLAAAELLGVPPPPMIRLRYEVSPAEHEWARSLLAKSGARPEEILVAIHPGTSKVLVEKRRWSISNFVHVARRVSERRHCRVVLLGGSNEAAEIREFLSSGISRVINLAGDLTLRQLAAVLQQCSMLVHNDSAPLHLAVAVGTPVLAIFGYQNTVLWGPLGRRDRIVRRDLSCSPCLPEFPCDREFECIRRLEPDAVFPVLDEMLLAIEHARDAV
jgi:lipopolysaccharide heptosyltransferase II